MKYCPSEEKTRKAWEFEKAGQSRTKVAMQFYVSERTLQRLYKYYGLGSPKRQKEVKK